MTAFDRAAIYNYFFTKIIFLIPCAGHQAVDIRISAVCSFEIFFIGIMLAVVRQDDDTIPMKLEKIYQPLQTTIQVSQHGKDLRWTWPVLVEYIIHLTQLRYEKFRLVQIDDLNDLFFYVSVVTISSIPPNIGETPQ